MRIAVIFHRLGPYHVARLNALAQRCQLTVVELTEMDQVYAWDKVSQGCAFERVTLFKGVESGSAMRSRLAQALAKALTEIQPDTVAAPGWGFPGALTAVAWCLRQGVPAVLMTESQASDHPRHPLKEWVKARVVGLYSAALVGGKTSADYATALGMPRERIFAGYDVVDNGYFERGADEARADPGLRKALGLPQRYWLASGRFVPQKNLAMLLRAYARYRASAGDRASGLVLLGDGPLKEDLLALRRSLGLEPFVLMPGFAQYHQLPAYYAYASAFVHVSTGEPWGLVVNEAMAARLPVLASRACGCVPDLVQDGVTGFSFDPTDEDALLASLERLDRLGPEGLATLGRAGQTLLRDWSPDRFGDGMLKAAQAAQAAPKPRFRGLAGLFLRALARLR